METPGIESVGISVTYGGVLAVDGVSLVAAQGRITGLIGPNGAGKTSLFNAMNGLLRPAGGFVVVGGERVGGGWSRGRVFRELGRTFQVPQICDGLTVLENVGIGLEARLCGWNPLRQFVLGAGGRLRVSRAVGEALALCSIEGIAGVSASVLTSGQRRLVELARVLAAGTSMLLLDEPSSGLDEEETAALGALLSRVVKERGIGVLLVEHDMGLVMEICEHIYVLNYGQLIFEGSPAQTRASELVREAYLGIEDPHHGSLSGVE